MTQALSVKAEPENTNYAMLLEDVVYTVLAPLNTKSIHAYFGNSYASRFCKVIEVKRKSNVGYAYEITYQFFTYERSFMPPYHLFTLTVENETLSDWVVKDVSVEKLNGNIENLSCRKPTRDSNIF